MTITQEKIVEKLTKELEKLDEVLGLVLIGSLATGLSDEYSDLDFWVTVKDGNEKLVIGQIESILSSIGKLNVNFHVSDKDKSFGRRVFHLSGTPAWHKIDVAIAPLSGAYVYTRGLDAPVKVLINKNDTVKFRDLDKAELKTKMVEKLAYHKELFRVHKAEIEKYCQRNKFLEAYQYYEVYALQPLVAGMRAVHTPTKQEFYLKHIYQELPLNLIQMLEELYRVKSSEDIVANLDKIEKLFDKLIISD